MGSMQDDRNTDDFEKIDDYSELSSDEIRDKMVWCWFRLFRLNPDFSLYCEAKRNNDSVTCFDLEKKFGRIAKLYEDWGDIHILPSMYDDRLTVWKNWFSTKQHLFAPTIDLVESPAYSVGGGRILASIPRGVTKKEFKGMLEKFFDANADIFDEELTYSIRSIKGETQRETLLRLERAELVNDLIGGEDDFKYTHSEIAELVLKSPVLRESGFNWYPTSNQTSRIENKSLQLSEMNDYKRTIVNLNNFYKACIESTVHGIFPATMKSKSTN